MAPEAVWAGASGAQEAPQAQAQKNAARGDSDGVFHFIELPKGRDSLPRQSGAACRRRQRGLQAQKSPSAKKRRGGRGGWEVGRVSGLVNEDGGLSTFVDFEASGKNAVDVFIEHVIHLRDREHRTAK